MIAKLLDRGALPEIRGINHYANSQAIYQRKNPVKNRIEILQGRLIGKPIVSIAVGLKKHQSLELMRFG